jgi:hypothetical protein
VDVVAVVDNDVCINNVVVINNNNNVVVVAFDI